MEKHFIDLSDIKDDETDKTASFTDLMTRAEKKERELRKRKEEIEAIDAIMGNDEDDSFLSKKEKRKLEKKKEKEEKTNSKKNNLKEETFEQEFNKTKKKENNKKNEELLEKTRILELTRQMKFNMQDNIQEEKKKGYNFITDIGICILIALAYFIYAILFTSYLDNELFLIINASIILFMFILFGITMLTSKKNNKLLALFNFLVLLGYIIFNILNIIGIIN